MKTVPQAPGPTTLTKDASIANVIEKGRYQTSAIWILVHVVASKVSRVKNVTNAATDITNFPIAGLVIVILTEPKQLLARTLLVHATKTVTVFARNWSREKSAVRLLSTCMNDCTKVWIS